MVILQALIASKSRKMSPSELDHDTLQHYATQSYIERANGDIWKGSGDIPQQVSISKTNGSSPLNKSMMSRTDTNGSLSSLTSEKKRKGIGKLFKGKREKNSSLEVGNSQRGDVEMAIRYVDATGRLELRVLGARSLRPIDKEGRANPYISLCLQTIDDGKVVEKKKTATVHGSLEPVYNNHFEFAVAKSDLPNYKVGLKVKDETNYGMLSKYPTIGHIEIRLDSLSNYILQQQWISLLAERK